MGVPRVLRISIPLLPDSDLSNVPIMSPLAGQTQRSIVLANCLLTARFPPVLGELTCWCSTFFSLSPYASSRGRSTGLCSVFRLVRPLCLAGRCGAFDATVWGCLDGF